LRLKNPAATEPKPSNPSSGSGEAVWGSFCPALAEVASVVVAALLSAGVALWSAVALAAGAAFWSFPVVELAGGFCALGGLAVAGLVAALWSVLEVAGLVAAALSVVLGVLGVCAGGFTGALALSEDAPAGLLVVAAGAFALFASVVGVVLDGVWFDAVVEALWSGDVVGAAALEAAASEVAGAAAPEVEAWLLVQESEIMFTELTCNEPSLARDPCTWTWCPSWGFSIELSP
jgi:hypothetical protein